LIYELELSIVDIGKACAYIGSVSGAEIKNQVSQSDRRCGVSRGQVIEESLFPLEDAVNDPSVQAIIETSEITGEKAQKVIRPVGSLRVSAIKAKSKQKTRRQLHRHKHRIRK
jgi:hypothetical protein